MAYIGNVPADKYSTLSKQTITGDGGTAYTLDYAVATAQDIEVFVNNVRQEPGVAYTVSGTALTMTGAVSSSDDFYVVFQGKAVQTTTHPSGQNLQALDAQLTGDLKLETSSGGIYTVTGTDTASNRTLTLPDEAGTVLTSASDISAGNLTGNVIQNAGPTFFAYKSSAQSLSTGVQKITYDTTRWNVDSAYNTSTSRFTPQVAGYYQINAGWYVVTSNETEGVVYLYMNGSSYSIIENIIGAAGVRAFTGSQLVYMNGSTDYLEVYAYSNRALNTGTGATNPTYFTGSLVRKA